MIQGTVRPNTADPGDAGPDETWHSEARPDAVGFGAARQGQLMVSRLGLARRGGVGSGSIRRGKAWQGGFIRFAWQCRASPGVVRCGGVRHALAGCGEAQ